MGGTRTMANAAAPSRCAARSRAGSAAAGSPGFPEEFAEKAVKVLQDPDEFRPLGRAAEQMIQEKYSLDAVLPQMLQMYEDACNVPRESARESHLASPRVPASSMRVAHSTSASTAVYSSST